MLDKEQLQINCSCAAKNRRKKLVRHVIVLFELPVHLGNGESEYYRIPCNIFAIWDGVKPMVDQVMPLQTGEVRLNAGEDLAQRNLSAIVERSRL